MSNPPAFNMPSTEQLLGEIRDIYAKGVAKRVKGRIAWTKHMSVELETRCPAGCHVCGHPWSDDDRGEYMVDLCWAIGDDDCDWSGYGGLLLAVETEWTTGRYPSWKDFQKLADVRADRRLFLGVLEDADWNTASSLAEKLADWLSRHRHFPAASEVGLVLSDKIDNHVRFWALHGDGLCVERRELRMD